MITPDAASHRRFVTGDPQAATRSYILRSMAKRQYESLAQAAERTGISVKTLRRRIIDGELVAYRSGRLIRVEPKAVDALFRQVPTKDNPH